MGYVMLERYTHLKSLYLASMGGDIVVLELLKGVSLLLALCMLQSLNVRLWRDEQRYVAQIVSGLLFGAVCVFGMMLPVTLVPGVIFDARSVVLSMAGLFGGPLVGVIAALLAGGYRLWLGGSGVEIGLLVISISVFFGLGYRWAAHHGKIKLGWLQFLLFGFLLHSVIIGMFTQLPAPIATNVLTHVAVPFVLIFTVATALLGAMLHDLAALAEAKKALQHSEARLRSIVQAIPDLLLVLDQDGHYLEVLSPDQNLLYADPAKLLGQRMHDILPPEEADRFLAVVKTTLNTEQPQILEYTLETLGGRRYFEGRIQPMSTRVDNKPAVVFLARDITEGKAQQQALVRSTHLLEQAGRLGRIGAWEMDVATQQLTWSPMIREIYEVDSDYQPNWPQALAFYESADGRERMQQVFQDAVEKGLSYEIEVPLLTAKGHHIWVKAIVAAELEQGKPVRIHGSLQDVTEIKHQNDALQHLIAITTDQNQRLQQFTYIVSHNIRCHVANLLGLVAIMDLDNPAERTKVWNLITQSTHHLDEVIIHLNDMINIQALFNLPKVVLPLYTAVEKIGNDLAPLFAKAEATLYNDISADQTVASVPAYLHSILHSLITNGLRYRACERQAWVRVYCEYQPGYLVVCVADNGVGLDVERVGARLFGLYQTFHGHPEAKGLGLFLTKIQIQAMKGKVEMFSHVDVGTTVKVYFPISEVA
jgi:PAS domain S-box-containing protein